MRVRCAIIPSDMLHISTNCRTAEKMALTLLDYLFHREVQAVSNLSGQGKHGKKQLDPLTIYGIRCKFTQLITAWRVGLLRWSGSRTQTIFPVPGVMPFSWLLQRWGSALRICFGKMLRRTLC